MADAAHIEQTIRNLFADIYTSENQGAEAPTLADDTVLLNTGLDSLGFAILVTRLEDELGYDPFSLAEDAYYPSTFREFVDFYQKHQPA